MTTVPQSVLMPGPCVLCGTTDYPLSMGGPTICPSCDCGNFNPHKLLSQLKTAREENARLATALAASEAKLVEMQRRCVEAEAARDRVLALASNAIDKFDSHTRAIGEILKP